MTKLPEKSLCILAINMHPVSSIFNHTFLQKVNFAKRLSKNVVYDKDPVRALFTKIDHHFIHKDFHEAVARMTIIDAFLFFVISKSQFFLNIRDSSTKSSIF